MGGGSFSSSDWEAYARSTAGKSADHIYTATSVKKEFLPSEITVRESRDSAEHPMSTPIILALDVTGSMGPVLEAAAKEIGSFMISILDRKTVTDPQIASMAIGDAICDYEPAIQFTQFESDNRCVDQLTALRFTRGGGGNDNESYSLAWIAAAYLTDCDSITKRDKKGYLITIGDENPTELLSERVLRKQFPNSDLVPCSPQGIDSATALKLAEKNWNCFHLIVAEGSYAKCRLDELTKSWTALMGQRAVVLTDLRHISEVITSIIEVNEGKNVDEVIGSWDGDTSVTVRHAVSSIVPAQKTDGSSLVIL